MQLYILDYYNLIIESITIDESIIVSIATCKRCKEGFNIELNYNNKLFNNPLKPTIILK